jgi:peptidoglycan/LPS O-acetylase OafA/YrhL
MATHKQRRQRITAAWIVGLLTLSSLALAVSGNHEEDDVFRWAGAVLAIVGACGGLTHLARGHAKGSPLVFAPARWFLITMIVLTPLLAGAFVVALRDGTNQFLSAAITPALIGVCRAGMFRSEDVVERERAAQTLNPAGSEQAP